MRTIARYLSRETVETLLAVIGVLATLMGIAQALNPDIFSRFPGYTLLCLILSVLLITYLIIKPKKILEFCLNDGRHKVTIEIGDVFNTNTFVVTADQAYSSDLSSVGNESLIGQAKNSLPNFDSKLSTSINMINAGSNHYEPGTVIELDIDELNADNKRVLILACGSPSADGTETNWTDLSKSLVGLWSYIRSKNISEISVPVIGSGFSGTRLSHSSLLQLILFSYYSSYSDRPVVKHLRIVVHKEDYDWDAWLRASRLLSGLGMKKL